MIFLNSNYTGKTARTLNQAFGPYHHLAPLQTEYMPMHKHDKIIVWGCFIAVVALGVLLYAA